MFKKTKVSHTTLQRALKYLTKKNFIKRDDLGYMNIDYKISEKGRTLLLKLEELKKLCNP